MKKTIENNMFTKTALAAAISLAVSVPAMAQALSCEGQEETPSLVVTTQASTVDKCDNVTSLFEAIAYANEKLGEDTITFASTVTGDVDLGSRVTITDDLTIQGSGAEQSDITIKSASGYNGLFQVSSYGGMPSREPLLVEEEPEPQYDDINFRLSNVNLAVSDGESSMISSNAAGKIVLEKVGVNESSASSLVSVNVYSPASEGVDVVLKNTVVTGSSFYNDMIRTSTYNDSSSEVTKSNSITIENSLFEDVEAESLASASTKYADPTISLVNTTINGGQWGRLADVNKRSAYGGPVLLAEEGEPSSTSAGEAIHAEQLTVTGATFNDGQSLMGINGDGALTLSNSVIGGNVLSGNALHCYSEESNGELIIQNTVISNNTFGGLERRGPVSYSQSVITSDCGNVSISNSEITGNIGAKAINLETSYYGYAQQVNIANSTIANNSDGGIVVNDSYYYSYERAALPEGESTSAKTNVLISNTTISGNAVNGGVLLNFDNESILEVEIANSTIVNNDLNYSGYGGSGYGGGISANDMPETASAITVSNSIIAENTLFNGGLVSNLSGNFTLNNNLLSSIMHSGYNSSFNGVSPYDVIYEGAELTGDNLYNIEEDLDAGIQPLSRRGGALVHALKSSSEAIGEGDASAENLPENDQQGLPRLTDGKLDIGAVQYVATAIFNDDVFILPQGETSGIIDVLFNDIPAGDATFDDVTLLVSSGPKFGEADELEDKTIRYTPGDNFKGLDGFTYQVLDSSGGVIGTASVFIGDQDNEEVVDEGAKVFKKTKDGSGSTSGLLLMALGFLGLRRLRK